MLTYWIMLLIPTLLVMRRAKLSPQKEQKLWLYLGISLTLLIGFRYEVGGDWLTYGFVYDEIIKLSFIDILNTRNSFQSDVGYNMLNWLSSRLGWGIYGANLVSAAIFTWGLVRFCRFQPLPILALVVSIPYLVIIVGMGYTRQAVAIGLIMAGFTYLSLEKLRHFIVLIILATLFHKTAIALFPLIMFIRTKNRLRTWLWGGGLIGALALTSQEKANFLIQNYVHDAYYQSEGTLIRLVMCSIPALLFLIYRKRLCYSLTEMELWSWLSLGSVGLLILFILNPSLSTPIDRMGLYLIPIQLFVFSRLPYLGKNAKDKNLIENLIIIYYGSALFVWLNYANTAFAWLPYQFYPWSLI